MGGGGGGGCTGRCFALRCFALLCVILRCPSCLLRHTAGPRRLCACTASGPAAAPAPPPAWRSLKSRTPRPTSPQFTCRSGRRCCAGTGRGDQRGDSRGGSRGRGSTARWRPAGAAVGVDAVPQGRPALCGGAAGHARHVHPLQGQGAWVGEAARRCVGVGVGGVDGVGGLAGCAGSSRVALPMGRARPPTGRSTGWLLGCWERIWLLAVGMPRAWHDGSVLQRRIWSEASPALPASPLHSPACSPLNACSARTAAACGRAFRRRRAGRFRCPRRWTLPCWHTSPHGWRT